MQMIDAKWNRDWNCGFSDGKLAALYPVAIPALLALTKKDVEWAKMTDQERQCLCSHIMAEHPRCIQWISRMVQRLPKQNADVRLVIKSLRSMTLEQCRKYADEIRLRFPNPHPHNRSALTFYVAYGHAACDSALTAYAKGRICDGDIVANAARAASESRFGGHNRAAERARQISDAVELLKEEG